MFRGVTQLTLDSKGRLAVPSKHRETLLAHCEGRLVVTADPGRCLLVYPLPAWEPIQQKLMALSSFNERTRALQRLLVGHADDVELDGAGRILIPPALRGFAGMERQVVLVGQGNRFELWDDARWRAVTEAALEVPGDAMPAELDGFSL